MSSLQSKNADELSDMESKVTLYFSVKLNSSAPRPGVRSSHLLNDNLLLLYSTNKSTAFPLLLKGTQHEIFFQFLTETKSL